SHRPPRSSRRSATCKEQRHDEAADPIRATGPARPPAAGLAGLHVDAAPRADPPARRAPPFPPRGHRSGPPLRPAPGPPPPRPRPRQHGGEPLGERIVVHGRVLDGAGRALPDTLVEIWQANAGGRYRHQNDQHPAPLDPNFSGAGRVLTGADGSYRFITVKPGAYPWGNHHNAWRPAHIHFSLFGTAFVQRLVTQMYFPGDPLFEQDPIFNAVRDPAAPQR